MRKDYFVIDFEYTHYTKRTGRPRAFFSEIIEIGAVKVDSATLEVVADMENFVRPHFFPKQASEGMNFSMITDGDMEEAIEFEDMLNGINELYSSGNTYFVTWGNDDFRVLTIGCERHSLVNPILPEDCLDLSKAYKLLKGDKNTTGLMKATEKLNIDTNGFSHTAYDDAYNTYLVLLKLIDGGWKPEDFLCN